jgi:hypothetical protein
MSCESLEHSHRKLKELLFWSTFVLFCFVFILKGVYKGKAIAFHLSNQKSSYFLDWEWNPGCGGESTKSYLDL